MTAIGKLSIINKKFRGVCRPFVIYEALTEVTVRLTRRQKITIAVLVPYWIVLLIVAHIPIPQIVYRAQVSDKWLHFLAYLDLVFLLWFSISPDRKVSLLSRMAWLILFAAAAYGGLDELLQPYVGRTCDLWDFVANAEGILAGLVMFAFLAFWQALLAVLAITIFGLTNLARADLSKLVPITDATFHVFAYGGFTAAWIQFMKLHLSVKPLSARLLLALGVPTGFMLVVKTGSLLLGRPFAMTDLLFSVLAVVGVVGTIYFAGLLKYHRSRMRRIRE
jgi:VanZ family protein